MSSLGDYPLGAKDDPKAPFNEDLRECPYCQGTGVVERGGEDENGELIEDVIQCGYCEGIGLMDRKDPEYQEYYDTLTTLYDEE